MLTKCLEEQNKCSQKIIIVKINDSKIGDSEINVLKVYLLSSKSYAYHTSETKLTICVTPMLNLISQKFKRHNNQSQSVAQKM